MFYFIDIYCKKEKKNNCITFILNLAEIRLKVHT